MEDIFIKAVELHMNLLNNMEHSWIIKNFGVLLFGNQLYEKIFNNVVLVTPKYNPIIGSILEIATHNPKKYKYLVNLMFLKSLNYESK